MPSLVVSIKIRDMLVPRYASTRHSTDLEYRTAPCITFSASQSRISCRPDELNLSFHLDEVIPYYEVRRRTVPLKDLRRSGR